MSDGSRPPYETLDQCSAIYPRHLQNCFDFRLLQPATILAPPVSVTAVGHPPMVPTPIMAGSPVGGLTSPNAAAAAAAAAAGMNYSPPCSTLFVANLGQFSSEQELKDLFSSFHGFSRLRMHNKGGSPVAFVEFQDVRQATEAMGRLQGFVLLSSDRGGIRIEYAKNKMGEVVGGFFYLPYVTQ
ncbi:hypothetical protein V1264_005271 [Littorina saxatilis]|uniref:RRM domain-containing protein n=1 Tax=Littorina saxatilis TaxID=31220 RepID=A0AAN9AZ59_9CAEN